MKLRWFIVALSLLPFGCGLTNDQLATLIAVGVSNSVIPARFRVVCSPLFRDVDIRTIVIEINTGIDADVTKSAALQASQETCQSGAEELTAAADAQEDGGEFMFDALDAAAYRSDCINCYAVIIDSLYDD